VNHSAIAEILGSWGLHFKAVRPDVPLAGSPERSLFRTVIEDAGARRFVLEQLEPLVLRRKHEIASTVEILAARGLAGVHPCLRNRDGDFISKAAGGFWQVSPFIDGVELKRPEYTLDAWRGKALARFLIDMRGRSEGISSGDPGRPFSIAGFASELMGKLKRHDSAIARAVEPAFLHLEEFFFPVHEHLPVAFCHGDAHPLNVIWGDAEIRGVIDWEFSGTKPEIYDAALMVGCIGMEDPERLAGPLVMAFLSELLEAGCFDASGFAVLPEFVLALRYAWLSDWLRKKDREMVEMETDYIRLLLDGREKLRRAWVL
jgi:homoserine kinase type II